MLQPGWDHFRFFFEVAKQGSASRAAKMLQMSQPTLSRRLKELEHYIGAPLFFRIPSGLKLTKEGEGVLRSATQMVETFEDFQRGVAKQVEARSSAIKLSATDGMTKYWLLPRIEKLREVCGDVHLEITTSIHQEDVTERDLDFVVRLGDPGSDELIGKKVGELEFGLFASRGYLARRPAPETIDDLLGHQLIATTSDFAGLKSEQSGGMPMLTRFKEMTESQGALRIMPMSCQYAAVAQGLGIAFLAKAFAAEEGFLPVLPNEGAHMDLWLLRRRETDLRKLTRQVCRFLEKEMQESRSWFSGGSVVAKDLKQVA